MTVIELKEAFDKFLKDNDVFEAWYERYRLDNLAYNDEVPIDDFLQGIINSGQIHDVFYSGIQGTCLGVDKNWLEEQKKCDILPNMTIAEIDQKWVKNFKEYINEDN